MRIVKNGDVHVSVPIGMSKVQVERFIKEHADWIAKARKNTSEREQRRKAFFQQLPLQTTVQKASALRRLMTMVAPMIEHHAKVMGVSPKRITARAMISRWGMCNGKTGSICLSYYLLLLPEWCVEHVVVHELCHLLEPSHNARFHALMDRYFPRWKEARRETRKISL